MMRIAVVGAGFSGLAFMWNLLHIQNEKFPLEIVLFDPADLGENASGVSAGLLHPYAGPRAKLVEYGVEGQAATLALIQTASEALGVPVAEKTGQIRPALTVQQKQDFFQCASKHADVHWHEKVPCPHICDPGIFIESSYLVKADLYLSGLWKACQEKGVRWEKRPITTLAELRKFDCKIITAGYAVTAIAELSSLPVRLVKGQVLEIEWPQELVPLQVPINSGAYLIKQSDPSRCIAGATFEHSFSTEIPDVRVARRLLQKKIAALVPPLARAPIVGCRSGIRAYTPDRFPLIKEVDPNTWVFTGLGSKGLLYHALFARFLAKEVMERIKSLRQGP